MDLLHDAGNMAAVQQLLRTNPYWANYLTQNAPMYPGASNRAFINPLVVPGATLVPSTTSQLSLLQFLTSQGMKEDLSSPKDSEKSPTPDFNDKSSDSDSKDGKDLDAWNMCHNVFYPSF